MSETLRLEHGVHAARHARGWITGRCHEWDCDGLAYPAAVLISELVTNVFLHARTDCLIHADFVYPVLTVTVTDEDSHELSMPPPSDTAEGGRGLAIVAGLAEDWGMQRVDGSKRVWFQLNTTDRA